jgi:hypothetical protein
VGAHASPLEVDKTELAELAKLPQVLTFLELQREENDQGRLTTIAPRA